MSWERALDVAVVAAREAGRILLADFHRQGGPRGAVDKADADVEAEIAVRGRLLASFPSWGYLGEETGRALGVRVGLVRGLAVVAVTVLAGSATAASGPIMFIGLGVPYLARAVLGPDQRLVLPGTAVAAPVLLLAADVLARLVVMPAEVPVGVVAAIIGGPMFVAIVRRPRIEAL